MNKLFVLSVMGALLPVLGTNAFASVDSVFIMATGEDAVPREMELKITNENGNTKVVDKFEIAANNIVSIEQGQSVRVFSDGITKARTLDVNDNIKQIAVSENGKISFAGYAPGVYVLDVVIGDKTYECIVVTGQQNQQIIQKAITKVNQGQIVDVSIEFSEIEEGCSDDEGSAGLKYPYDKKSECEYEEHQDCERNELQGKEETDRCDELEEGFFDDCEGYANAEDCAAGSYVPPTKPNQ
jgi:hypothetical protein